MALMSSGGGLSNRKLELATAVPEDVIAGKTFYSGDKEIKSGVIPDYGYDPLAKSVGTYNPGDGNRVYLYLQNADTDQQDVGGHVTRSICAKSSDVLNALYSGNIIKSGAGLYWTYSVGYEHQVNTSVTIPAGQGYRTVIIIDMRAIVGTPVAAAEDGEITIVYHWNGIRTQGDTNSYGNMVKMKHDSWKGGSVETLYAHLNSTNVKVGQKVRKGDIIGYSGNTGNSFGAHLHFEVRYKGTRTNPLVWLDNDFTLATGKEYTFDAGEHSVDTSVDAADSFGDQSSTTTPVSTGNGCMDGVYTENEIWGIDVSKYQGSINWRKVAASGVKFAMLRVVSTNKDGIYIDPTFKQNYKSATEAGIEVTPKS